LRCLYSTIVKHKCFNVWQSFVFALSFRCIAL